jgi:orotate phosphoribosyltransferase
LKSKRILPYFFNAGDFDRADLLRAISTAYAKAIIEASNSSSPIEFDVIFVRRTREFRLVLPRSINWLSWTTKYESMCYSFDRKEAKNHGEGGNIVGAPLKGKRVLIADDVVTAGTAKREAVDKIRKEGR